MNDFGSNAVLSAFVLFCRIGACLMLMPGFSSQRVPVNVRLFIAIAVTLALFPLLSGEAQKLVAGISTASLAKLIGSELTIGGLIGFMGRIFFSALETMATAVAMSVGLSNPLGAPIDEDAPLPAIATLITFSATTLLFVSDQHWEILRGILDSYVALPMADGFGAQFGLVQSVDTLGRAFLLALRISSPFVIFAIIVNFALGIVNKLTPVVPVYFVMTPFVLAGALFLLYFTVSQLLELFMSGFGAWLVTG